MNLNISEIEQNMFFPNQGQGQSAPNVKSNPSKKKVTYDDILSSLQMKVIDGKLQLYSNQNNGKGTGQRETETEKFKKVVSFSQSDNKYPYGKPSPYLQPQSQVKMAPKTLKTRHLPIPQEYVEENTPQVPMTRQQAIIQLLQARQEADRINQIKSRKLAFSNQNINVAPTRAPQMSNMFFKFK
jgi:hypothetical protein